LTGAEMVDSVPVAQESVDDASESESESESDTYGL
jgi:hypothetical protein